MAMEVSGVYVHFGMWNLDGKPLDPATLARVHAVLAPFAYRVRLGDKGSLATISGTDPLSITVPPFPTQDSPGFLWDGRLDNREELLTFAGGAPASLDDQEIVEAAFERLGTDLFSRIAGDWALSVVHLADRQLILAKDFAGTRPLYYWVHDSVVAWSTVLEPLVLLRNCPPALSDNYLAGWLSFFPESHLTPYQEVLSLPPASFARITRTGITVQRYWTLESTRPIRHRTDRDYEEHFRSVLREAVRRRIRSGSPILAELSGGMDSSAIVCMADTIAEGGTRKLDTITYFDSSEAGWDELPYARQVEEKRGRVGYHIDVSPDQSLVDDSLPVRFTALPPPISARGAAATAFDRIISENGYSVVFSGIGGDEMLGGVPTPLPELADCIARLRFGRFFRESFCWALAGRKPIFALWRSAFGSLVWAPARDGSAIEHTWTWLKPEFRTRAQEHFGFRPARFHFFGPLPSLQANTAALEALSRQISVVPVPVAPRYEWRYPFLDRDLVAFCSAVPREQLVRPSQRRSLMRRALAGIVPRGVLERKRKAFVSRGLVKVLRAHWQLLCGAPLRSEEMGFVDGIALARFVELAEQGNDVPILPLLRTLALEHWLRDILETQVNFGALAFRDCALRIHAAQEEFSRPRKTTLGRR
jgi:asparagine synthase (glutamine-hydrolysing)